MVECSMGGFVGLVALVAVLMLGLYLAGRGDGRKALAREQRARAEEAERVATAGAEEARMARVEAVARQALERLKLHEQRDRSLATRPKMHKWLGLHGEFIRDLPTGEWELDPTWAPPSGAVSADPKPVKRKGKAA